ncbi:MAG: sugar ABC transporter ATP-binding protein [Alicyclobacillaceae bacterium]|nr:sugar ABC transporter ATP-binding protein [Alicyclobacillaceae bacterium]
MEPILRIKGISKSFPGVQALRNVSLDIFPAEVHGIVGANGAGKSTLMKVLSGVIQPDAGEIVWKGAQVRFPTPLAAQRQGIAIIHQEFSLVPTLSVAENIFLGRLAGKPWKVSWRELYDEASALLERVGAKVHPKTLVRQLRIADMQFVEIAKALSFRAEIVIMDEPSAVLSGPELQSLFRTIEHLTQSGVGVVYISHRLEEITDICERISVMRDGQVVETFPRAEANRERIIRGIAGADIQEMERRQESQGAREVVLDVVNLSLGHKLTNIRFSLRRGEILGLAGLVGSGRSEIARSLFGLEKNAVGEFMLNNRRIRFQQWSPRKAIQHGITMLPEDRKNEGLLLSHPMYMNVTMTRLPKVSRKGWMQFRREILAAENFVERLRIKAPSVHARPLTLSGGNQQKVVFGKCLFSEPQVLILDEPTRGVDIGARQEIYHIIRDLAAEGKSILLISSDWAELMPLCDRIIVIHEGKVKAEFHAHEADVEKIMQAALN